MLGRPAARQICCTVPAGDARRATMACMQPDRPDAGRSDPDSRAAGRARAQDLSARLSRLPAGHPSGDRGAGPDPDQTGRDEWWRVPDDWRSRPAGSAGGQDSWADGQDSWADEQDSWAEERADAGPGAAQVRSGEDLEPGEPQGAQGDADEAADADDDMGDEPGRSDGRGAGRGWLGERAGRPAAGPARGREAYRPWFTGESAEPWFAAGSDGAPSDPDQPGSGRSRGGPTPGG
jgi:hypothetical protein